MASIETYDNTKGLDISTKANTDLLGIFANQTLYELTEANEGLLVFPADLHTHKDKLHDNRVCSLQGSNLNTYNTVGFIGIQDEGRQASLQIQSRFDQNSQKQYFLQYMLGKVFCPTLLNLPTPTENENIWDFFLALLFPYYLKKALAQGLFKQYRTNAYNDTNVKGKIDINRHLKRNTPFMGNIAYTCREFSFDNPTTQLIRHTLHYLDTKGWLFDTSFAFHEAQQLIKTHTPSWKWQDKQRVIAQNKQRLQHPYFYEYEPLRKICLRILASDSVSLASENEQEKVYGVLFDASWIWEEYLATLLQEKGFTHPKNKESEGAIYVFKKKKGKRYPDFYKKNVVCDAKYKRLDGKINSQDLNQMIVYLYLRKAKQGIFIYPTTDERIIEYEKMGKLHGYRGAIGKVPLPIPQQAQDFTAFVEAMRKNEGDFLLSINSKPS